MQPGQNGVALVLRRVQEMQAKYTSELDKVIALPHLCEQNLLYVIYKVFVCLFVLE